MHVRTRLLGLLVASSLLGACQQQGDTTDTEAPDSLTGQPTTPAAPGSPAVPPDTGTGTSPVVTPPATPPTAAPPPVTYTREWVVSPSGNDSAAGSAAAPFRSIGKALSVAGPGERITVKAGTYAEPVAISGSVRAGTAAAPIRLQGEGKPTIVPSSGNLVSIEKPYWQVDGFNVDVKGQARFAVAFIGNTQGSVLSGSEVHGGTGGGGVTTYGNATGATIEGNHIYGFDRGDVDSHGVVVQPTSKNITVRNNRIHDNSGDSVQCIGPEGYSTLPPADGLLIEGNELYTNRENAVDIKTCYNVTVRRNVMRDFLETGGCAVVVHMSARDVLLEDNDIWNVGRGIALGGNHEGPVPTRITVRRNRIRDVVMASDGREGNAIRIEGTESVTVAHNTVVRAATSAVMAGRGTGGSTSNLKVFNNILQAPSALYLSSLVPGVQVGNNLYLPGSGITALDSGGTRVTVGVPEWLSWGRDPGSVQDDPALSPTFVPDASAVDRGRNLGLTFCGAGPDIGAVETGC